MGQDALLHLLLPCFVHLVGHVASLDLSIPEDQVHLAVVPEQEVEAGLYLLALPQIMDLAN